jgi:UDP-N-acetylglucosamine transferase subunit ALG13
VALSSARHPPRVRICLAASGGGHIRQLLDLRPFWDQHETHFVTEPTPLARNLAKSNRVHVLPHFAFGQFRLQPFWKVCRTAFHNFKAARSAVKSERPQLVISTGAGAVFFAVILAKLGGARFILIETFARFDSPSLFARLSRRFADAVIVQSEGIQRVWPDAELFDPFIPLGPASDPKDDLALITVGTVMPFDRLVEGVAALSRSDGLPARVIAQVGSDGVRPDAFECFETVECDEMSALLDRAKVVFCHGGTGSFITALRSGCRVVAMARRADLGEHYDDHQSEIVTAFAARGMIEVAEDSSDLGPALARSLATQPQRATTDYSQLIARLRELAAEWFPQTAPLSQESRTPPQAP